MNEIEKLVFYEKYRPQEFKDLILSQKNLIMKYLEKSMEMPSFIFYSDKPGTGKTTCARLMAKALDCDMLEINSSKERGIDTIREKISLFVQSLSTNPTSKRMVFCDEADGMTPAAVDSLKNMMETFSSNCFFVLTCNNLSKISAPIRSRCILVNFEKPNKQDILNYLEGICIEESISFDIEDLVKLVDLHYPDIRSMVQDLQSCKVENKDVSIDFKNFEKLVEMLKKKNVIGMKEMVYGGEIDISGFVNWYFRHLMDNIDTIGFERVSKISKFVADIERNKNLGSNMEIVFLSNMIQISILLNTNS